jgi:hypothetical protein
MADEPMAGRSAFADIAPALGDYTDKVLSGDVWERPGLSKRDRASSPWQRSSRSTARTSCRFTSSVRLRTASRALAFDEVGGGGGAT